MDYRFNAKLWKNKGKGGWHFVTIPLDISENIYNLYKEISPGWGSIPVIAKIDNLEWNTSAFYDTKETAYLLPIKGDIRKKGKISVDDIIIITLKVKI